MACRPTTCKRSEQEHFAGTRRSENGNHSWFAVPVRILRSELMSPPQVDHKHDHRTSSNEDGNNPSQARVGSARTVEQPSTKASCLAPVPLPCTPTDETRPVRRRPLSPALRHPKGRAPRLQGAGPARGRGLQAGAVPTMALHRPGRPRPLRRASSKPPTRSPCRP